MKTIAQLILIFLTTAQVASGETPDSERRPTTPREIYLAFTKAAKAKEKDLARSYLVQFPDVSSTAKSQLKRENSRVVRTARKWHMDLLEEEHIGENFAVILHHCWIESYRDEFRVHPVYFVRAEGVWKILWMPNWNRERTKTFLKEASIPELSKFKSWADERIKQLRIAHEAAKENASEFKQH